MAAENQKTLIPAFFIIYTHCNNYMSNVNIIVLAHFAFPSLIVDIVYTALVLVTLYYAY